MPRRLMIVVRPVAGGMWQHLLTLTGALSDSYDISVCCPPELPRLEALRERGVEVIPLAMPASISPFKDLSCALRLRGLVSRHKPDLIHSHGFHAGLITAAAQPRGTPHVCTLHTMAVRPDFSPSKRRFYELLQRILLRSASHTIVITKAVLDALPSRPAERVSVISNGVSEGSLHPVLARDEARRRLGLPEGCRVAGCVARLSPEKGVEDLVRAAALLPASCADVHLVVVGDGPERGRLSTLATELGVEEKLHLIGEHFPGSDFMQLFDVTVVPSLSEGQSLVCIESLLLGKPVLATSVGGLVEIVTPEVGVLAPPADPPALAAALARLIDSPELSEMGERGRQRARSRFSVERMIEETEDVYRRVLEDAS